MPRSPAQTTYVSISFLQHEKEHLDKLAEASGMTRNRYLRTLLADQTPEPETE